MAKVQSARDKEEFIVMLDELERLHGRKSRIVAELAALWGLRISDLLSIKYSEASKAIDNGQLDLIEGKTKKTKSIPLTEKAFELLDELQAMKLERDIYLFQSGYGCIPKPISRHTVWRWVKDTQRAVMKHRRATGKLGGANFGTHSLRKSGSRIRVIEGGISVQNVQKLLNHSNINTTLIYLDLDEQDVLNAYKKGDEVLF